MFGYTIICNTCFYLNLRLKLLVCLQHCMCKCAYNQIKPKQKNTLILSNNMRHNTRQVKFTDNSEASLFKKQKQLMTWNDLTLSVFTFLPAFVVPVLKSSTVTDNFESPFQQLRLTIFNILLSLLVTTVFESF